MPITRKARYDGKSIILNEPVDFPINKEIKIQLRIIPPRRYKKTSKTLITDKSYWGIWAQREDIKDSVDWVNEQRERWTQRTQIDY